MTALFNSKGIFQCGIIVCLLFAGVAGYAQTYKSLKAFNKDTSAYIQYNFIDNKSRYINQPIDKLLNELEVPIIHIVPAQASLIKLSPSPYLYLFFFNGSPSLSINGIIITLSPSIEKSRIDSLLKKAKKSLIPWNTGMDKLYRRHIITDIGAAQIYLGTRY